MSETRLVMGPGRYRNHLGAELHVERLYDRAFGDSIDAIGAVWLAWQDHGALGRRVYLVTREGLEEAGYARVEGGDPDA